MGHCNYNFRVYFGSEWLSDLWSSQVVHTFTSNWINDVCVLSFFVYAWVFPFSFCVFFNYFVLFLIILFCYLFYQIYLLFGVVLFPFWVSSRSSLREIYSVFLCCHHVFLVDLTLDHRDLSFVDSLLHTLMSLVRSVTFEFFLEKGIQIQNTTYNMELLCLLRFANIT